MELMGAFRLLDVLGIVFVVKRAPRLSHTRTTLPPPSHLCQLLADMHTLSGAHQLACDVLLEGMGDYTFSSTLASAMVELEFMYV